MITKFNNIVLSFDHCSFDQLKLSNHSLTGWGSDLPFSHDSVVSIIAHEQNIICSKTLICRQLFPGHVVGFWPMKTKEKIYRMITAYICCKYYSAQVQLKPRSCVKMADWLPELSESDFTSLVDQKNNY